jgi:hypothetical protein
MVAILSRCFLANQRESRNLTMFNEQEKQ